MAVLDIPACTKMVMLRARVDVVSLFALIAGCPPEHQTCQEDQPNRNKCPVQVIQVLPPSVLPFHVLIISYSLVPFLSKFVPFPVATI